MKRLLLTLGVLALGFVLTTGCHKTIHEVAVPACPSDSCKIIPVATPTPAPKK